MTRVAVAWDRIACLLVGLILIVVGLGALLWPTEVVPATPQYLTAPGLVYAATTAWWPWATTGVGVVLVVLGLWWLTRHRPRRRVSRLALGGSSAQGRYHADLKSLAEAAAQTARRNPAVESATGTAVIDRGRPTIELTVTAASADVLADAAAAADDAATTAIGMLDDTDVSTATTLKVRRPGSVRRVN